MIFSRRRILLLVLLLASGALIRFYGFSSLDGILPMDGLYVDEVEYSRGLEALGDPPFQRPPGTYLLAWAAGLPGHVHRARIVFSVLSMIPALAILAAFGSTRWGGACSIAAVLEPLSVLFGLYILPAAPAAALIALALLSAHRGRILLAGFITGCAALFRGEALLLLLFFPLFCTGSVRNRLTSGFRLALPAIVPIFPVLLVNLVAGTGPVLSVNGTENLWLGTSWELASTPPGVEFEALMRLEDGSIIPDQHFSGLALERIGDRPVGWIWMGVRKVLATLTIPGPGRNVELSELLRRTHLVILLPISLLLLSLALARIGGGLAGTLSGRLSLATLAAAATAAFVFIPAARYRTAFFPAILFIASFAAPSRRDVQRWIPVSAALLVLSLFLTYPGSPRSGLTEVQAAEEQFSRGRPGQALDILRLAESRGYTGADMHNIRGACLSQMGRIPEGLDEFRRALAITPGSPTLWRNTAVALWNSGHLGESREAAFMAVRLDPALRAELAPILEWVRTEVP